MIPDADEVGGQVDALLAGIGDPSVRRRAEEVVAALLGLYGAGLERMLELAWRDDGSADALFAAWGDDPLLRPLLLLHGLHPLDVEARIEAALERVRPHLASHGGDVELVEVAERVARLRLRGHCDGCPSSMLTMQTAVRRAIAEAAPDVERVELVEATLPPRDEPLACPPALLQEATA